MLWNPHQTANARHHNKTGQKFWGEMDKNLIAQKLVHLSYPKNGIVSLNNIKADNWNTSKLSLWVMPWTTAQQNRFVSLQLLKASLALNSQLLNLDSLSMLHSNRSLLEVGNQLLLCCSRFWATPSSPFAILMSWTWPVCLVNRAE